MKPIQFEIRQCSTGDLKKNGYSYKIFKYPRDCPFSWGLFFVLFRKGGVVKVALFIIKLPYLFIYFSIKPVK